MSVASVPNGEIFLLSNLGCTHPPSPPRTFALAACGGDVYAPSMVTAVDASRGSQDETPFPLEFDIVAGRKRVVHREGRSQDETAPFPPVFEVVARKTRQSQ